MSKDLLLFCAGIIELFWGTIDFKLTQKTRPILTAISTFVKIFIWYLVLRTIVENLNDLYLVSVYALGCSLGCYLGLKLTPTIDKFLKIERRGKKSNKVIREKKKK